VLATQGFNKGRRYWEVKVQKYEGRTSGYIGICLKQETVTLGELRDTYGLLTPECKTFERKPDSSNYRMERFGNSIKEGDRVGLLLEFNEEGYG